MRTFISTAAVVALAAGGLLYAGPSSGARPEAADGKTPTRFAFKASGYGTRLSGGQAEAGSDSTAFQAFGCTNDAGTDKQNYVASADLGGAGEAQEVTTRLWSTIGDGIASTYSQSHIERVTLVDDSMGMLELTAVDSLARTFHDAEGFHAEVTTTLGTITFTPPDGEVQSFPAPSPGQSVEIPGVAIVSVGVGDLQEGDDSAKALADGVRVQVLPTGTDLHLAHARAKIERGVQSGLMRGHSFGAGSTAVDDLLKLGRTPLALMPCRGTDGVERAKSVARIDLGEGIVLRSISARQQGQQGTSRASGFERGRVGALEINDADLLINNIVGRVNVLRLADGTLKRNTDGTQLGEVMVQGEPQEFPPTDVLEIPGVARLERNIVDRTRHGISVIALRVTLLDGTGAVLSLGTANLSISPASR